MSFRPVVTRIPIERLFDEEGEIGARRERMLSRPALEEMLRQYRVEFFVADVGLPLKRIDVNKCYEFWKSEVKAHLVDDPENGFHLEDYPDEYAYIASEWSGEIQTPIVLLEKQH